MRPPAPPPVNLHRVRFLDSIPSPITSLSFAPLPLPSPASLDNKGKSRDHGQSAIEFGLLFVARENGNVEIWSWDRETEGNGNWTLTKILPPTLTHPTVNLMSVIIRDPIGFHAKGYHVPKMEDLRLFTAGNDSSEIIERCLFTGRVLNTTHIPSAPIWSMSVSPTHQYLALSTTAQTLTFLALEPNSPPLPAPPHLLRCEPLPSRCRTVSIAWGPPKLIKDSEGEPAWVDTYLITGNSDSSLRKWELPLPQDGNKPGCRVGLKGRAVVERIQKAGRGGHGKKSGGGNQKGTIVWGVGVLPDHTIVSSDSLGSVTFWDGATLAQNQTFQAHRADGMCLTIGPSGRSVFTSGPDQRVCQFTNVPTASGEQRWLQTSSKRIHSHDVRSLAVFPPYTPHAAPINSDVSPVLASGGWDMIVTLTPCATPDFHAGTLRNPLGRMVDEQSGKSRVIFDESFPRRMPFFGGGRGTGRVQISREGRLAICRNERSVGIWKIGGADEDLPWEKCLDMDLRLRTSLTATAVSNNGQWIAISDLYETKLFQLYITPGGVLSARRAKNFINDLLSSPELAHLSLPSVGTGASTLLFTPDSQRLVISLNNSNCVVVIELSLEENVAATRVMKVFEPIEAVEGGRRVVQHKKRRAKHNKAKTENGGLPNGNGDAIEIDNVEGSGEARSHVQEVKDSNSNAKKGTSGAWVVCMATSEDGQWLAVSDLLGRSAIFNLDTLRLHSTLPTFPAAPTSISFPPSHPSLLSLTLSTGVLHFYHIEHGLLLPPTPQLSTLNSVLSTRYAPLQDVSYEPNRSNIKGAKVVCWGYDWLCSAHLDLDLIAAQSHPSRNAGEVTSSAGGNVNGGTDGKKTETSQLGVSRALRKKRAREAREALEAVSISGSSDMPPLSVSAPSPSIATPQSGVSQDISMDGLPKSRKNKGGYAGYPGKPISSADDPEFYKVITDKFRSIAAVDWFSAGELVVVERPYGDFVNELPQAFWSGSFGRS